MKEDKQIKIKLTTTIILILIAIILIVGVVAIMLNKNINSKNSSKLEENKNVEIKNEEPDTNLNYVDTDFSWEFLKMENDNQNIVYSPLSIKYALKILNEGANGNTKTQIENVIGNIDLVKYDNIDNILSLANVLYIIDSYSQYVKEEYKSILLDRYNAEIKYDGFKDANNINSWIEKKTFGQIKNMLEDDMVQNERTEMLLINALAIDMEWKQSFDTSETYGEEFNLENGDTMTATTMHKETTSDSISYYKNEKITSLAMDLQEYGDTQLQFIAIMPEENLSEYIGTFTTEQFTNIINKLTLASNTDYGVDISIPKFSFDYDLKLKDDLISLGITDAFDENLADFSNASDRELYISDALHKANIDFTEKGIKAAAVTVFNTQDSMVLASINRPEEIKIDNPFLYIIRDKNTGEIWFIGTVYEPNSWENDQANYGYR